MNFDNHDKQDVLFANRWIVEKGLTQLTWGNVSARNIEKEVIYIKPSGVNLDFTTREDISEVTLSGVHCNGKKPSVDVLTHLELYKGFPWVNSVVHTHSKYATLFAQANMDIPCLGTTHADYFYGDIPCVPHPTKQQTNEDYELNTGVVICEYFAKNNIDSMKMQSCVVSGHGTFSWGHDLDACLENAFVLETLAEMAHGTLMLNKEVIFSDYILEKHFLRKHGDNSYYGQ
tara:strand:+ start:7897 stop:8589 length:693 start_codon:yes stop_codon:yes gene_type:complete